jgi:hypothetical protein
MQLALLYPEVLVRWFRDGAEVTDAEDIIKRATERALAMKKLELASGAAPAGMEGEAGGPGTAEESFGTEAGQTERDGSALS